MANSIGQLTKTETEVLPFAVDFKDVLPSGEVIQNTSTMTATDSTGGDVTSTIIQQTSVAGTQVQAILRGGTNLSAYVLRVIAITLNYRIETAASLQIVD